MEPARWQEIEELLQSALDLDPRERSAFLSVACGDDRDLRREVDALLSRESEASLLSQSPSIAFLETSLTGRTISHYRIARRIGAGGMGEVYEAHDENLQRTVALKVLPEEFTNDAERVRRFEHEAFAASRLNHPNIITIFETLHCDGAHLIATEHVEGQTLRALLGDSQQGGSRALPVERALDIAIQVATALKAAHTAWIIHRDIKPENIMVRSDGVVKVLDFGIAKMNEEPSEVITIAADRLSVRSSSNLTIPGAVLGTASYMSPEQARGEPLDGRTDLFSLGLVLYEMVAGERLSRAARRSDASVHAAQELLTTKGRLDQVPKEIQPVVRKLLQSNRDQRYSSAGELLDELHRVKRRLESRTARRMVRFSAMAVVVAVAVIGIAAFLSVNETWEEHVLRDGHAAAARQAVFSPDGRVLVSCGEDGQVIVWRFATRERLATLTGHPAHKIAYSPDGRWLATGGTDGSIVIWDTQRWTQVRVLRGHRAEITALAFSLDTTRLASADSFDAVLWDTRNWRDVLRWPGSTSHGIFIFTQDRHLLYSCGLTVQDLRDNRRVSPLEGDSSNWIALSPDTTRLAAVDALGNVSFYRFEERSRDRPLILIARVRAHQDHGRGIAYSPDGHLVASAAEDILLWDPATQQKVARFAYSSIVWSVAFSPDGRWLISTHGDGSVLIWDVAERECVASLNEHSGSVRAVAFSPDGRRVVSAGEDRTVILWDLERGRKEAVLAGHGTRVTAVSFSRDGTQLGTADQNGVIILWDVAKRTAGTIIRPPEVLPTYCLLLSPDNRFLVSTPRIQTIDGRVLVNLERQWMGGQVYGADYSDDGRFLATAASDGWVAVWDGHDFRVLEKQRVNNTHQISVSVSPNGKWLATGEDEGAVRLWSVHPLRQVAILGRHTARVKSVAFSPDGATVASAGDDKMIALWDVERRKLRTRVGTHASPVYSVAFSPDGRRLVSGEHDRSVRLYTRQRTLWGFRLE